MTNFEKYENELIEFFENNGYDAHPAVVNGKLLDCREVLCRNCVMTGDVPEVVGCRIGSYVKWLHQEYTEPKKLTKRQRAFCEAVGSGWLVRSFSGNVLNCYVNKPKRVDSKDYPYWTTHDDYYFTVHNYLPKFEFIKWEDEPYSIEEMLTWEVEDD